MKWSSVMKQPSAFLPVAMSGTALVVVVTHIALHGVAREPDEGSAAHVFQLLMAGQLPIIVMFAIKWLRQAPRQAILVLGLQLFSALAAMAPVFYFQM